MCRRSDAFIAFLAAALALAFIQPNARGDDVADFLEHHGLKQLLASHLEQQIEATKIEDRGELVLRLAALYAELLESVNDPAQRAELEERARRVLDKAPPNSVDDLRLALLRASYRTAEKTAENYRLRLATPEDLDAARQTLTAIIPQLNTMRQRLKSDIEVADRRLARSTGSQALLIGETGERTRVLHAQCTFLNAWALYYQSWLHQRDDNAKPAEALFGEILAPDSPSPQPADVSIDLRETEAIARSILGMALCKSLTSSSATAISWINLLEHENTFEPLRVQAPAWKIAIYLERGEYQSVRDLITRQSVPNEIPLAWLRLIAVNGLENAEKSRLAGDLGRWAVLEMATRGELEQILDLANRYGSDSLGQSGFALQYVHGVIKYQEARAAHNSETPTLDDAIVHKYTEAAAQLQAAIAERDAANYPVPVAACLRLIAWCDYFQCRFLDARDAFDRASKSLTGKEAAESLWMAIVAQDKVLAESHDPNLQAGLDALVNRFLEQFPSSEYAPKLRLRQAISSNDVSERAVEELLAIPPNSDVYDSAQRRAADMLYQLFRASPSNERVFHANRFLSIALSLLSLASREVDCAEPAGADRFVVRCRQVLEVALSEGVEKSAAARDALIAIAEIKAAGNVDLADLADELDCRRVQERLLERDSSAAAATADVLWNRDSDSFWTRLAVREMFKDAHHRWKSADSTAAERAAGLELVIRYGGRVLHEFKDADRVLDQPGALGYHVAVADASMELWQRTGQDDHGRAALFLYEKLLAARPRNAVFLRSVALLSEHFAEYARALDCWRTLIAGSEIGTEPWYEAKFHLIYVLSTTDPPRAREVMDQHKQLNPDYGPDPWGGRLKGLDLQIPQTAAPVTSPAGNADEGPAAP